MIRFFTDAARRVAIKRDLAEAHKLLDAWKYGPARGKAQEALHRAQTLKTVNPSVGLCYALLGEITRREGSGPFGIVTEPEIAAQCIPLFRLAIDNLEPALGADSSEVKHAVYYSAFVLSQLKRYDEAIPLWRRIIAESEKTSDREGLLNPLWRLGQALRLSGATDEAIHVLRRQVSLETEFLGSDDEFKRMNVQDMLMFDYYRGSFELAALLIEGGHLDEAEPLLRYIQEAADRPSICPNEEFNQPRDRVRELIADLEDKRNQPSAAEQAHLERVELAIAAKPRPFRDDCNPLAQVLDDIDAFYKKRGRPVPFYARLEARTASLSPAARVDITLRAASQLAAVGDYTAALEALERARSQGAGAAEIDKRQLAYLVLAGRFDEAAKLASAML